MLDLGRTFLQSVERSPGATAVVDGLVRFTYAEWFERIRRVAGGLAAFGLRHGDHLLVILQNRWEMATLHWACQFAGIIVTPFQIPRRRPCRNSQSKRFTHCPAPIAQNEIG